MKKPTKAIEDYLEALLLLEKSGSPLETTALAKHLGVTKSAVNQMAKELKKRGYIEKEKYGDMRLTTSGRSVAAKTYHRHTTLRRYLEVIGVSPETAENDCCLIEHVLSNETFKCIEHRLVELTDK
jgi:DtxR family transcriptional regulator, Mn-dependent transcriptional regulator